MNIPRERRYPRKPIEPPPVRRGDFWKYLVKPARPPVLTLDQLRAYKAEAEP